MVKNNFIKISKHSQKQFWEGFICNFNSNEKAGDDDVQKLFFSAYMENWLEIQILMKKKENVITSTWIKREMKKRLSVEVFRKRERLS
jgi:hypothetical protein